MAAQTNSDNGNGNGIKAEVRGIADHITRHQANIDELYGMVSGVGRTNWQTLLSAVGVMVLLVGGLWALSVSPINEDLKRLDRDSRKQGEQIAAANSTASALAVKVDSIEKTVVIFRDLIRRVEDERLPTREFMIHQSANANDRNNVQRQVDDLNKKIDAVFPPAKVLEDLVRRLSELERTRATLATSAAKP